MKTTSETTNIEKLKSGVWDIHEGVSSQQTEKKSDEESIMKGTLPKFKYINSLKQRYILQREFEVFLARHKESDPFLSRVVTEEQFHAEKSEKDLEFFGVDPKTVKPVEATNEMITFFGELEKEDTRLLLSTHYIIEGSNNGAMFIAKAVKEAYGLEGNDGTYHLQPYGNAIREKWQQFREAFNELEIDDALMKRMIEVGRQTFHHMNAVSKEAHSLGENVS